MNLRCDLITRPQNDEEFGPFGQAAISLLDMLFPEMYSTTLVVSPSFNERGKSNICPQFERGDFFALSSVEVPGGAGQFKSDLSRFANPQETEISLDRYRYEHAIFASNDLGILTAWAQAEYAVVAFRKPLLNEYEEWLETMSTLGVLREID